MQQLLLRYGRHNPFFTQKKPAITQALNKLSFKCQRNPFINISKHFPRILNTV